MTRMTRIHQLKTQRHGGARAGLRARFEEAAPTARSMGLNFRGILPPRPGLDGPSSECFAAKRKHNTRSPQRARRSPPGGAVTEKTNHG